ncbi:MAG: autotransporter-associated beta strand repeat-containing protein [Rhizomicrobium sp.]
MGRGAAFCCAAALAPAAPPASADTTNWDGGTANWTSATDWDNGIPTGADDAVISGGFVTVNSSIVFQALSLTGSAQLSLVNGAVLPTSNIDIGPSAEVQFGQSGTVAIDNTFSGGGIIDFSGGGTYVIDTTGSSDSNEYLFDVGTIKAGGTNVFGATPFYWLRGLATLDLNGFDERIQNLTSNAQGTAAVGAQTLTDGGGTFAGKFTGTASANLVVDGSVTLNGDSPNFLGTTTVNSGMVLQFGISGTAGSIGGSIVNNGTIEFSRSNDVTVANNISGAGQIQQEAGGAVIFSGSNTYSGNSVFAGSGGTFKAGSTGGLSPNSTFAVGSGQTLDLNGFDSTIAGLSGSGGTLALGGNQLLVGGGGDTTFGGAITGGGGSFDKIGSDTLTLSPGVTGSYTGATVASGGTLIVNGDITSSSGLTTANTVRIGGTGSLPGTTLGSGATLEPGDTVNRGTLTIGSAGTPQSVDFGAGSAFEVRVTSQGSGPDELVVTGGATIDGSASLIVDVQALTQAHTPYTILTTGMALADQFNPANITFNGAGSFIPSVTYGTNSIIVSFDVQNFWTGADGADHAAFNSSANWNNAVPGAGDTAVFGTSGEDHVVIASSTTIGAMTFNGDAYTFDINASGGVSTDAALTAGLTNISGQTQTFNINGDAGVPASASLTLNGAVGDADLAVNLGDSASALDIGGTTGGVTLRALTGAGQVQIGGQALTLDVASGSDTFAGQIADSGSGSVVKSGAGTLVLTGISAYGGGTTVQAGTLQIGNGLDDGSSGGVGGTINLGTSTALAFSLFNDTGNGNTITGSGTLTQSGPGTLTLGGTYAYTGATTVAGGTLDVQSSISLSSGLTVQDGGRLIGSNSGTVPAVRVQSGGALEGGDGAGSGLRVNGDVTFDDGSTYIVKLGAGTSTDRLARVNNVDFTGTAAILEVDAGTATLGNTYALLQWTGSRNLSGGDSFGTVNYVDLPHGLFAALSYNDPFKELDVTLVAATYNWTGAGSTDWNGGGNWDNTRPGSGDTGEFSTATRETVDVNADTDVGGLDFSGDAFTFDVNATGAGSTTFGIVGAGVADSSGNTQTINVNGDVADATDASLAFDNGASGADVKVVMSATHSVLDISGATGDVTIGSLEGGGRVLLGGNSLNVGALGGTQTYSGVIASTGGGLSKNGGGAMVLTGDNTYTGVTTIFAGEIRIGEGLDDGSTGSVAGDVDLHDGTTLDFDRFHDVEYDGAIEGTGAEVSDEGAGTLTLTADNSYAAPTVVSNGTLLINGTIASSASLTANSGATVGGTGTVPQTEMTAGTTLAPGPAPGQTGTLTVSGELTLESGSTYSVVLGDSLTASRASVIGAVTIADQLVTLSLHPAAEVIYSTGDVFTILTYSGSESGRFDPAIAYDPAQFGGLLASVTSYDGGAITVELDAPAAPPATYIWTGANSTHAEDGGNWNNTQPFIFTTDPNANTAVFDASAGSNKTVEFFGTSNGGTGLYAIGGMAFDDTGYQINVTSGPDGGNGQVELFLDGAGVTNASEGDAPTFTITGQGPGGSTAFVFFTGSASLGNANYDLENNGWLELDGSNDASNANITVNGFSTLSLGSASGPVTIGAIDGDGTGEIDIGTNTVTVSGLGGDQSYGGNVIGTGNLIKDGPDRLALGGDAAFSGAVTVQSGTLQVDGDYGSVQGFTVESGATLSGTGMLGGTATGVEVQSGARLSAGDGVGGFGTLTVLGGLTLDAGSFFSANVSNDPHIGNQVDVSGDVALGGELDLDATPGSYAAGESWVLIASTGGTMSGGFSSISGDFGPGVSVDSGIVENNFIVEAAADHTWKINPPGIIFGDDANWIGGAPASGDATGFFGASSVTDVHVIATHTIAGLEFLSGASAFTFNLDTSSSNPSPPAKFDFVGAGIVNDGFSQAPTFALSNDGSGVSEIDFHNSATAGIAIISDSSGGDKVLFADSSDAGAAQLTGIGDLEFRDGASANTATIEVNGTGSVSFGATGGNDMARGGSATITNDGPDSSVVFQGRSSAGTATITNTSGELIFRDHADGSGASIANGDFGTIDISGETLDEGAAPVQFASLTGSGTVELGANQLEIDSDGDLEFDGDLQDGGLAGGTGGSFEKLGSGTLTLGGSNTYTGATDVAEGTLEAGGGAGFASGSAFTVESDATLDLNGYNETIASLAGAGTVALGTGSLTVGDSSTTEFDGALTGSGMLFKAGSGQLTLAGDTGGFSGDTDVLFGTLQLGNGGATGMIGGSVTVEDGAILNFDFATQTSPSVIDHYDFAGVLHGSGNVAILGDAPIVFTGAGSDFAGQITVEDGATLRAGAANVLSADATYMLQDSGALDLDGTSQTAGALSGDAGTSLLLGSQTLTLTGSPGASHFNGTISGTGTLELGGSTDFTLTHDAPFGGTIQVDANTRLHFGDGTPAATTFDGTLSGNGAVEIASGTDETFTGGGAGFSGKMVVVGTATFDSTAHPMTFGGSIGDATAGAITVTGSGGTTFTGNFQDGPGGVTFAGSASFTGGYALSGMSGGGEIFTGTFSNGDINGDDSAYTGTIEASGGLTFEGNLSQATLVVNNHGTLQPSGTPEVGMVEVQGGGKLQFLDTGSVLTVDGNLTLAANATYEVTLDPCGCVSVTDVTGATTLAGTLKLDLGGDPADYAVGTSYTLFNVSGTPTGQFDAIDAAFDPGIVAHLHYGDSAVTLTLDEAGFAWSATPGSGDWNTAANWAGGVVPTTGAVVALGDTGIANLSTGQDVTVSEIDVTGATPYTITVDGASAPGPSFTVANGAGVVNTSGQALTFVVGGTGGSLTFDSAALGSSHIAVAGNGTLDLKGSTTLDNAVLGTTGSAARIFIEDDVQLAGASVSLAPGTSLLLALHDGDEFDLGSLAGGATSQVGFGSSGVSLNIGGLNADTQFDGTIGGSGSLVKTGAGTLILTGANAFDGTTRIDDGTLQLGDGTAGHDGTLPTLVSVFAPGTLAFDFSTVTTVDNTITGTGTIGVLGTAPVILTHDNLDFTGTTTIAAGATLQIGDESVATGSIGGDIVDDGALVFDRPSGSQFFMNNAISGSGSVEQKGEGFAIVTSDNTYTGTTTIDAGAQLYIGNFDATGSLTSGIVNNGSLIFQRSDSYHYDNAVGGSGDVTVDAGGMLTLNAAATYSGMTTVQGGATLRAGAANVFSPNSDIVLCDCGTLDLNGFSQTIASLTGGGNVTLGSATLTMGGTPAGTFNGAISGSGGVTITGTAPAVFTNANIYGGTTTIEAGAALGLSDGLSTTGSVAGAIVDDGQLFLARSGTTSLANAIRGTGGVADLIDGSVTTLDGSNSYSGDTDIQAGTLQATRTSSFSANSRFVVENVLGTAVLDLNGHDSAIAGLDGDGTVLLSANLALGKNGSSDQFDGTLSGTGGVTQVAGSTQIFDGDYGYTGASTVNGVLAFEGAGGAHGGDVAVRGGGVFITDATSLTLSGAITGTGTFRVEGGTTILTGSVAGTVPTAATGGGTLQVGAGGTAGTLGGNVDLSDNGSGGGTLVFDRSGTLTYAGAITDSGTGEGTVMQSGPGTLILAGSNSYGGTTVIAEGSTLQAGNGGFAGWIGSGGVTDNGTLVFASSAGHTISAAISGSGDVVQSGSGTTFLRGTNLYQGSTAFDGGVINIASEASLGGGALTFAGGTLQMGGNFSLVLNRSIVLQGAGTIDTNDFLVSIFQPIGGAGRLIKTGSGLLALAATNSYGGGTTVQQGALQIGTGGTTGTVSGDIVDNSQVNFDRQDGIVFAGAISGTGGVLQLGGGTLTLTGNNTYAGGTFVNAGTLALSGAGTLAPAGRVTVNSAATFDISAASAPVTIGQLSGSSGSAIRLGANTLTVAYDDPNVGSLFEGVIAGSGGIVSAQGLLFLGGVNTYTGGTTVSAGTLALVDAGALAAGGALTVNGGTFDLGDGRSQTVGALSGTGGAILIGDGSTLTADSAANTALASGIGSSGTFVKAGTGTLVYTGDMADAVTVIVGGGVLQLGNGAVPGFAANTVVDNATLAFDYDGGTQFVAGTISGSGVLRQIGSGTTILAGADTYAGGTTITAGTLQVGSGTSGAIVGDVTDNGVLAFGRSDTVTFGGAVSGAGGVSQTGSGTLILTGANTYAGGTTIASGTLQLGDGGTVGSVVGDVADDATLVFDRSDSATFDGTITGTGNVSQIGVGSTILTASNTYAGGTTIAAGALQVGNGGTSGAIAGDVLDNGLLLFDRSGSLTFDGAISGTGSVRQIGPGTLILTGANAYFGGTSIASGTLQVGSGTSGAITGDVADDGILAFGRADTVTFGGAVSGSGSLNQIGGGTLILTGSSTYTGRTTIASGTLQIGNGNGTGQLVGDVVDNSALVFDRDDGLAFGGAISGIGTVTQAGAGVLTLLGNNTYSGLTTIAAGTLRIGNGGTSGEVRGNIVDNAALVINRSNAIALTGDISGTGSFTQSGDNLTTLLGTNTYTGGTFVNAGELQVGGGGDVGATIVGDVTVNSDAVFSIYHSNTYLMAGVISGAGSFLQDGVGTTIFTAAQSYSGGTTIFTGTLQLGDGGTAGSLLGDIVDNGFLAFDRADSVVFTGIISGSGGLEQIGNGTTTLTAASSYAGFTYVNAGRLSVNGSIASSAVAVNAGGTLGGTGTVGATTVASGGMLAPGNSIGTLTVAGDLVLAGGSHYLVEVGPSAADETVVSGAVSIAGDLTLAVRAGTYSAGQYTLIGAAGLLTGAFSAVDFDGAFAGFNASIDYGAHDVFLTLVRSDFVWVANPGSGDWNTGANWTPGSVPTANDTAVFDASRGTAISIAQPDTQVATMVFDQGAPRYGFDIEGGSLALGGGGIEDDSAIAPSFTVGNSSAGQLTFLNGATAGDADIAVGPQGTVTFADDATGSTGTLTATAGGTASFDQLSDGGIAFGTVQGGGSFMLGANTLTTGGANTDAEIGGVVSGTGGGLTKVGSATLILSGANTYTGTTTVGGGTLQIGNGGTSGTLGSGAVVDDAVLAFDRSDSVTIANIVGGTGGVLQAGSGTTILTAANSYTGGTTVAAGTVQIGNGGTSGSIAGDVADAGTLAFNRSDTTTFGGAVGGSGSLVQSGDGALILTGTGTYTGGTTIAAGILQLGNGGTGGSVTGNVSDGAMLAFDRSDSMTFSGVISGIGGVSQIGAGTTILTAADTYTGGTTISAGTLALGADGMLPIIGATTIGAAGALDVRAGAPALGTVSIANAGQAAFHAATDAGAAQIANAGPAGNSSALVTFFDTSSAGQASISNTVQNTRLDFRDSSGAGSATILNDDFGVTQFLNFSSAQNSHITNLAGAVTAFGQNAGAGLASILNGGSGAEARLYFEDASSAAGATIANAANGMTEFDGTSSAGSARIVNTGGETWFRGTSSAAGATITTSAGGTTLFWDASTGGDARIVTNAGGIFDISRLTVSGLSVGSIEGSGLFALGSKSLTIGGNESSAIVDGVIADGGQAGGTGGSVAKAGSGTTILTGANTYTGGTAILAGTLQIGDGGTTGTIVGDVSDNGTLAFARSDTVTFGGVVSGSGGLAQMGGGNLILTAVSSYAGTTSVGAGRLSVNGAIASSSVSVAGGAVLGGTGTVGATTVASGGTLAPGNSIGTLTVAGDLMLAGGSHAVFEVSPTAEDEVLVGGAVSIAGDLTLVAGGGIYSAGRYLLIDATAARTGTFSAVSIVGSFSGLAAGLDYEADDVFLTLSRIGAQWSATPVSGDWNTGANWAGGAVPAAAVVTIFDATTVANVAVAQADATAGMSFVAGAPAYTFTIAGSAAGDASLTIGASGIADDSANRPVFVVAGAGGHGGTLIFDGGSAGDAVLTANAGGSIVLAGAADAGAARVIVDGGTFDVSGASGAAAVGSLEGAGGTVALGINGLSVGALDTSTVFGGAIGGGGGLAKTGTGTFVLTGAGTYAGGTTIGGGTLQVGNGGTSGSIAGAVDDNGMLAFNRSDAVIFAGAISGSGSVQQTGGGATILTGANTYAGGTTISAGTLQLGAGGTSGSIAGAVNDNGVLAFDRSDTVTFGGVISGTGSVKQIGAGTTILTAADTYTGGTTIASGTLQLGNGGTGGSVAGAIVDNGTLKADRSDSFAIAGAISGSGALVQAGSGTTILTALNSYSGGTTIASGTLQLGNGGTTGSFSGNVTDDGTLAFDRSGTITFGPAAGGGASGSLFGGTISGTGGVAQIGSGTLILTAANTYGGGTTIGAGTLQIGEGHSFGSIVGNVTDDGRLVFDRADDIAFAGTISGSGSVTKLGGGTLVLTADNSYGGTTTVTAGTLQLGNGGASGGVAGAIVDNGAVVVNRTGSLTLGGAISGDGSVTKLGGGTLVLAGLDTYTGATDVVAGTLAVDGSIAASGVTVQDGAMLGGTGTVGTTTVADGGTLDAGDGIGTLHVAGDLTLASGSHLVAEVGPSAADETIVSGAVSVAGDLTLAGSGGAFAAGQYTLINSTGLLTGTFSALDLSGGFGGFDVSLDYDAHDVILVLDLNGVRWSADPVSGDWNTGANWLIGTVPAATDKAYFGASTITGIDIDRPTAIAGINIGAGAPAYTFNIAGTATGDAVLTVGGSGVGDASGNKPIFVASGTGGHTGTLTFADSASADAILIADGGGFAFLHRHGGWRDLAGHRQCPAAR